MSKAITAPTQKALPSAAEIVPPTDTKSTCIQNQN